MEKSVLQKIKEIQARFAGSGKHSVTAVSNYSSLAEVIKTKEQADLFMKRLRALES